MVWKPSKPWGESTEDERYEHGLELREKTNEEIGVMLIDLAIALRDYKAALLAEEASERIRLFPATGEDINRLAEQAAEAVELTPEDLAAGERAWKHFQEIIAEQAKARAADGG